MPLASVGAMERRQTALSVGGVVDGEGRVVTCVTHSGGCRYHPYIDRQDHALADLIWLGQQGTTDATRADRASLPCEVVEIPKGEIQRRTERAKRERARQEYVRTHKIQLLPDDRDAQLAASLKRHRLDRQTYHTHQTDVREGYGDTVPSQLEEME